MKDSIIGMVVLIWVISFTHFGCSRKPQHDIKKFRGVVTLYITPAKVIRINKFVKEPKPGKSCISDEGLLFEMVDDLPEMQCNWTMAEVSYYQYSKPKAIKYMFGDRESRIIVKNRAVSLKI
jgi:hypothetical protein